MLPEQFCVRMKEMLGEEYAAFYASYDLPKYQALRINPLKTERDTFLQQAPFSLNRVPWTTNGYYYSGNDQPADIRIMRRVFTISRSRVRWLRRRI